MRVVGTLLASVCLAVGLAGCADDNGGAIDVPATTAGPGSTSTTATGIDPLQGAGITPVSTPRGNATSLLTAVRVARQEGFDRVVFEFENAAPGYKVSYIQKPVTEDASGRQLAVKGNFVVEVRMEPAATADLSGGGDPRRTYTGPTRVEGDTSEVTEVVKAGDFEAVLTWVIGLTDKVDFKVSTLQSPARLVVDLRNH